MSIIIETCPKCGHDLTNEVLCTYPPIPRKVCFNCGWSWEGEREEVVRVPFGSLNSDVDTLPTVTTVGNVDTLTTVDTLPTVEISKLDLNYDNLNGYLVSNFEKSPCDNCSNNFKNGGSGLCGCILGTPKITY